MIKTSYSVNNPSSREFFEEEGYVIFDDLFLLSDIQRIQEEFFYLSECLIDKYELNLEEGDREYRAFQLFNHNKTLRNNIYTLNQQLRSITILSASEGLSQAFRTQNLKVPVLRNQALRIDFAQESQFLQGIHQDVRGMRSANCLNFWIPLQSVNEYKGTLCIFPKSHKIGGILPTGVNESGYQIFTDKDVAEFEKLVLDLPQGSAVMFHPYLFHGSVAAKTKSLRLTVTLRFDDVSAMNWLYSEKSEFSELDIQDKKIFA
jgi:hypothetical protein